MASAWAELADDREPGADRKRTLAEAARRLVTGLVGEDPRQRAADTRLVVHDEDRFIIHRPPDCSMTPLPIPPHVGGGKCLR